MGHNFHDSLKTQSSITSKLSLKKLALLFPKHSISACQTDPVESILKNSIECINVGILQVLSV